MYLKNEQIRINALILTTEIAASFDKSTNRGFLNLLIIPLPNYIHLQIHPIECFPKLERLLCSSRQLPLDTHVQNTTTNHLITIKKLLQYTQIDQGEWLEWNCRGHLLFYPQLV